MAKFKPGVSGNPSGRPKLPPELRAAPELTPQHITRIIGKYSVMSKGQLEAFVNDPNSPGFEAAIASGLLRAIKDGDMSRLEFLMQRSIGKVKDVSEVHQHNYDPALDEVPKENIIQMLKACGSE